MREPWPDLPFEAWKDTYATLHRYTQIAGKIRTALTPLVNHYWNAAFHLTPRGLTSRPIPYGDEAFAIDFDFVDHQLVVETSTGARRALALVPRSVAELHYELMALLHALGIEVRINDQPQEIVEDPIPFREDQLHRSYDEEYAARCFRIIQSAGQVFEEFRAAFTGKCSPVHFFWGSFDLAVTRFSGRLAPERAGADRITRESYSHECSSAGFWPGDAGTGGPMFYAYTAPPPEGLAEARIQPAAAFWSGDKGEFFLPYQAVRTAASPREVLMSFLQSTYEAGADRAGWDRESLERRAPRAPAGLGLTPTPD